MSSPAGGRDLLGPAQPLPAAPQGSWAMLGPHGMSPYAPHGMSHLQAHVPWRASRGGATQQRDAYVHAPCALHARRASPSTPGDAGALTPLGMLGPSHPLGMLGPSHPWGCWGPHTLGDAGALTEPGAPGMAIQEDLPPCPGARASATRLRRVGTQRCTSCSPRRMSCSLPPPSQLKLRKPCPALEGARQHGWGIVGCGLDHMALA